MNVTKAYEFIGFGAMDVTKAYEFIGFGARDPAVQGPGYTRDQTTPEVPVWVYQDCNNPRRGITYLRLE